MTAISSSEISGEPNKKISSADKSEHITYPHGEYITKSSPHHKIQQALPPIFEIPYKKFGVDYKHDEGDLSVFKFINLYYSTDRGLNWKIYKQYNEPVSPLWVEVDEFGEYSFYTQIVNKDSSEPAPSNGTIPKAIIRIIELHCANNEIFGKWRANIPDDNVYKNYTIEVKYDEDCTYSITESFTVVDNNIYKSMLDDDNIILKGNSGTETRTGLYSIAGNSLTIKYRYNGKQFSDKNHFKIMEDTLFIKHLSSGEELLFKRVHE